ncbi:MAG: short-chain dehydrogenase [Chitinophagaceae bacterium]
MTNEQIEKFLQQKQLEQAPVRITFKTRKPLVGLFIKTADYAELKTKNFWRVVGEANIENYNKSKDMNLAKIYSGSEFTKLAGAK